MVHLVKDNQLTIRFFDKFSVLLILMLYLPLLFFPKINLFQVSADQTAGIRIDDILMLLFSIVLFWAHFSLEKRLCQVEKWVFLFTFFSLVSFFSNKILVALNVLHTESNIFYSFRMLEYFLYFYIGAFCSVFFRSSTIIKWFFFWNVSLMILQKMGILGRFSSGYGFISTTSERVTGIASFPSEAGLLLNMVFCFLAYDDSENRRRMIKFPSHMQAAYNKIFLYLLFFVTAMFIIMSGSRIAIIAIFVTFLFRMWEELKKNKLVDWVIAGAFLTANAIILSIIIANTNSVFERSSGLFSFKNIEMFFSSWEEIDIFTPIVYVESVEIGDYDASWLLRIHKWMHTLKTYCLHPECYLQGLGPGVAPFALDGGILRILTENGIIGCFLFWKLLSSICQLTRQLKWIVIVLLINMIFFDAYLAYKPMSLLFFLAGHAYAETKLLCIRRDKRGREAMCDKGMEKI